MSYTTDIPWLPLNTERVQKDLAEVSSLQVGFGSKVLRIDQDGIWLGAEKFADAPFSVDMDGNVVADSLSLSGYVPIGGSLSDIGVGNITGTYIANGAITTAKLTATAIDGMTITGALIRTSSTGSRVEIDGTTDDITIYDSGNDLRMKLDSDELGFYNTSGVRIGYLDTPSTTNFRIASPTGNAILIDSEGTNVLDAIFLQTNSVTRLTIAQGSITVNEDIIAGNTSINIGSASQPFEDLFIDDIRMTAQTSNPTSDGMMRYYDSGGSEGLRMQFGGSDFQFDASGV